jgi:hypothetical protein
MKSSKSRKHRDCCSADLIHSGWVLLLVVLSSILTLQAFAESGANIAAEELAYSEYKVKAAYLYNFPKFISWPVDSFSTDSAAFNLCVLGENVFEDALLALQSKTVSGKQVKIAYKVKADETLDCHLLFISSSESGNLNEILPVFESIPIVTISDISGFAKAGGIIELTIEKGRIVFIINQAAALRQRLSISASLLDLATTLFQEQE